MSDLGHNANGQLRSIIDRIESLEVDRFEIASEIKDLFSEAKGNGYDVAALRTIIRLRKESPADREAREAILDTYKTALGMT